MTGERRLLGLYTHTVYTANPGDIPVLRTKVAQVLARAGFLPASHDGKALASILEDYPRDELMQIEPDELYAHAIAILRLGQRQRTRLLVRRDAYGRFVTCLLYVPRDKYNTEQRQRFQRILAEAFNGTAGEFSVSLSESPLARIFMVVRTRPGAVPEVDVRELERRIVAATRRWEDDLQALLLEREGEERGNQLFARYGQAFPAGYREDHTPRSALLDLETMEALGAAARAGDEPAPAARRRARPASLQAVPRGRADRALGRAADPREPRRARARRPALPRRARGRPHGVDRRLRARAAGRRRSGARQGAAAVPRGFRGDVDGRVEPDNLNRLVLAAELSAREIAILRAYTRYLRQAGIPFSLAYMEQALVAHAGLAQRLVALFEARFSPGARTAEAEQRLAAEIEAGLEQVPSLDDDRILRRLLETMRATTRTNAFQRGADGARKPYISLKFDPAQVPGAARAAADVRDLRLFAARRGRAPAGRPGRARRPALVGPARGLPHRGARPDEGADGEERGHRAGRREGRLRAEAAAAGRRARGAAEGRHRLLPDFPPRPARPHRQPRRRQDRPPPDVVRHDDDDPYLVVAADKGTASFSDIANGVAAEYGFWLGDAFASGGSAGYDHKKMGITARGAWESVKRHFRELGIDTQSQPFTVVGIGDMSGDVFGNGMLLSRHIRLVAAFDHRHIFIDPDPDPDASFRERERLFALPRSSWADYDAKLISKGGGVLPRSAKSIRLSAEARRALGHRAGRADAERGDERDPEGAGRPALQRRHRHLRQVQPRERMPRSATAPTTRCASTAASCAARSSAKAATSG